MQNIRRGLIPQGWRIGEIGGVEVRVDVSLLFIAFFVTFILATRVFPFEAPGGGLLLYWLAGLLGSAIFIGSILWHEMAHALLAMRYGIPVVQIVLHLFGGVAQIAREPERPGQEFEIAIAGPLSSMFLAILFGLLGGMGGIVGSLCSWVSAINLTLALFNLLPGFPLDGGRVLRALLWRLGGSYRKATQQASRVGQGMAILFVLFGVWMILQGLWFNGIWFMLIAAFLYSAATASRRMTAGSLNMQASIRRVMRYQVPVVEPALPLALLAWRYLDHARDQAFPVMHSGELVGLVSALEVDRVPRLDWGRVRVAEVMLPRERLVMLSPHDDLQAAMQKMDAVRVDHAPVFEAGQLVGMVNRRDIVYRT